MSNDNDEFSKIIENIKKDNLQTEDNGNFEKVINRVVARAENLNNNKQNFNIDEDLARDPKMLLFKPIVEKEVDGIGMGVLESGIPYLTGEGLIKMCGIDYKTLYSFANFWETEQDKPRGKIIKDILEKGGYTENRLFIPIQVGNTTHHAYPEIVCIAFLEYYAFHSKPTKETARKNLILLARKTFRDFIYSSVGYKEETKHLTQWKYFHDRVSLNRDAVPKGYFSVFKEISGMIVDLINAGLTLNDNIIPDISVGLTWANFWKDIEKKYKERLKYLHNYPEEFKQSLSNPQECWAYPLEALGEFRLWFENTYLKEKYPPYIEKKIKKLEIDNLTGDNLKRVFIEKN